MKLSASLRELNEKIMRYNITAENNRKVLLEQINKLIGVMDKLNENTLMDIMSYDSNLVDMEYLRDLPNKSNSELQVFVESFEGYLKKVRKETEQLLNEL